MKTEFPRPGQILLHLSLLEKNLVYYLGVKIDKLKFLDHIYKSHPLGTKVFSTKTKNAILLPLYQIFSKVYRTLKCCRRRQQGHWAFSTLFLKKVFAVPETKVYLGFKSDHLKIFLESVQISSFIYFQHFFNRFRNLRGKKIKPDEQPPHLNKLRTRLPPTGICELIKEHNLNGNNSEHGTGVFSGVQVEEKSNTDPDSFGRNLRISADESKPCDNKIEHRSVIYVSNQFELVLACENLINEPVIGLSIQGRN